jgi:beta-N-acetylhexosaminidase
MVLGGMHALQAMDFYQDAPAEEAARALLDTFSDQEALAQTFMLGWVGADPSPLILRWIRERKIGGVKIFGWNTEDTVKLAKSVGRLQEAALESPLKIPLLVATDQEGGWIRHVKGSTSDTPGNMAIGASGFPRDAYLSGYYIGRELAALGINMNFAPTVDLFTNRDSVLIGTRAFGDDPVKVGTLGIAFAKGLEKAGVIATAKHFPGHGDTDQDSHGVLPVIEADIDLLWNRELVPYRMLSKEKIPSIMSGHLAFPNTPARLQPASLSPYFMTEILRKKIGYDGLVITDDLMMNGATLSAGSVSRAAKRALEAGNDILMLSNTPFFDDAIWTHLVDSMAREADFRDRVRDAALRVLTMKLRYLRSGNAPPLVPDIDSLPQKVPDPDGQAFFLDLAVRSATVVKGKAAAPDTPASIPFKPETSGQILLAGQYDEFFKAGRAAYPGAAEHRFSLSSDGAAAGERTALLKKAKESRTVIFCLANNYSLSLLQDLQESGIRVLVVSVLSPMYIDSIPWADGIIAVYSYSRESFIAAFSTLLGRIPGTGVLPFSSNAYRR